MTSGATLDGHPDPDPGEGDHVQETMAKKRRRKEVLAVVQEPKAMSF